jgi:uncharacterized protein YidB (DUF937 family)
MPSMLALLGLLAVAGFQNRDKIADALKGAGGGATPGGQPVGGTGNAGGGGLLGGLGGLLGGLGGQAASGASGNVVTGGLGELMESFKSAGHGDAASSWVTPGVPTQSLTPEQVEQAVGSNSIDTLAQRLGVDRNDLLQRLATAIPESVDKLTPNGNLPANETEAMQRLGLNN